jgi:hypothetical protein
MVELRATVSPMVMLAQMVTPVLMSAWNFHQ